MPNDGATDPALGIRPIEPAYRQVADQLRSLIIAGELEAGSRLPNEADLSAMFGVSRSTVREALRALSSQGLLVTKRGVQGGSFVARPEPAHISRYLETSFGLLSGADDFSVGELIELRELLEVPAAELAASRRTPEQARRLQATLAHDGHGGGAQPGFEERRTFHQEILELSGNRLLPVLARPVFVTLQTRFLRDRAPQDFWRDVDADHDRICEHIMAGDGAAARQAMREHLESLARVYEQIDRTVADQKVALQQR